MELTKSQKQAIRYTGRNLQLIACAGSGKTEVVAQRVAYLLTKRRGRLKPRNIIAFTFTDKAAAELKERIVQRTREAAGGDITGIAEMYVGTIHGFCQNLLQQEVPEYLKYEVLDANRQVLYVNRKSARTGLTSSTKISGAKLIRYIDTGKYISALAVLREDAVKPDSLEDCSVVEGLSKYRKELDVDSYFDFSAMLEKAVTELTNNHTLRALMAERVKYIVVDEYQDVNPIQERLVRLLHDLGAGLCVVGDDDQTIYQWRGSSVENILTFDQRYPDVKQIRLEANFRSNEGVIETAREFVTKIDPRLPKAMKFADAQKYEDGDIVALNFDSPEEEAQHIVETIRSLYGIAFDDGTGERGLSWSDMAVLLRSVRNNGTIITEALKEANIPFIVSGLTNLFETDEACAARDLFYFIANETNEVTEADLCLSWGNSRLGMTKRNINKAVSYVAQVRNTLYDGGDKNPPTIQAVFLRFLELAELREEKIPDGQGQVVLFNLGKFSQVISDWESINFASKPIDTYQGFAAFLRYQASNSYSEGEEEADYITPDAVQVMTVHQAKGREWPAVFIPALLRNRFPSPNRRSDLWQLVRLTPSRTRCATMAPKMTSAVYSM